jgi:hypothetical protein
MVASATYVTIRFLLCGMQFKNFASAVRTHLLSVRAGFYYPQSEAERGLTVRRM